MLTLLCTIWDTPIKNFGAITSVQSKMIQIVGICGKIKMKRYYLDFCLSQTLTHILRP